MLKAFLLKFTSQRQAGYSFVSRTVISSTRYGTGKPVVALRAVIANPLTTEADIDEVLLDQLAIVSTEHRLWRATIHVDASSGSISLRPIGSNCAVRSR